MRNSLKVYFIIIFSTSCYDNVYSGNVISRCKDRCEVVKHQVTEAEELVCGATCRVEQCKHGCGVWKDAMLLGCPVACNGTASLQHKMQYCVQGCSYALDIYAQDIRGVYRNMTSSSLKPVVGGVNSSSVILKWEAQQIAGLNYYVQKKYTPLSLDKRRRAAWPGGWEYHRSAKWTSNQTLLIWGLRPYVQYKFRLEVVISATHTVMLPESVPVATKEFGLPPEAPKVTRVAPSSTSIHIMWDAPVFTNGRLHVYQLTLRKMLKYEYPKIKEVPASKQPLSTVFTLLEANTTYNLSIAARNLKGAGPSASLMVSTQPLQSAPGVPAHLIVGSDNTILKLNLASLYDSPVTLYTGRNTSAKIKGVALHYRKNLMIFSDSTGRIRSRHVNGSYSESKVLCMRDKPTTLSIDWLHDKLYIMERARISQCDLDCGRCISVLHGFTLRPGHLVADPGDGYLFWSQSGQHQGLYRMDLADVGKSVTDPSKYLIVRNNSLYGFMVDFPNYRLYYPDYQEKVMISAYLDGSDEQRMVRKVARSQWHHVESLVYHQGLFYWTSGTKVYQETYNPQQKKYFHNEMWQWHSNGGSPVYNGLSLWHPVSQPIPVPLSAPHQVCALFTSNSASVSWKPPQLELGQGAWHEWQYEIEIVGKQGTKRQRSIDKTSSRVLDLKASSQYHIRVRGYSTQGPGPWSQTFTGSTLQAGPVAPKLLYADRTRIFSSRIDGSENKWILSTNLSLGKIVDVDAYDDLIMWTQHRGAVFIKYYNRPPFHLGHIKHAVAVAYDWLAQKVYWSNHKQNTIMRSAVNGSHMEMIYYSMAQDLVLDSYNAFLYWTTDHSLESIRLNGQGHQVLQSLELFSGIYTMGLTVNVDSGHLYWVVKAVNKATLYRTRLLEGEGGKAVVEQMGVLHSVALRPVLHYFSNHFVFLDSNNKPVITDWGLYRATIDVGEVKVQTLTVYHPSLYKVPGKALSTTPAGIVSTQQPAGTDSSVSPTKGSVINATTKGSVIYATTKGTVISYTTKGTAINDTSPQRGPISGSVTLTQGIPLGVTTCILCVYLLLI